MKQKRLKGNFFCFLLFCLKRNSKYFHEDMYFVVNIHTLLVIFHSSMKYIKQSQSICTLLFNYQHIILKSMML